MTPTAARSLRHPSEPPTHTRPVPATRLSAPSTRLCLLCAGADPNFRDHGSPRVDRAVPLWLGEPPPRPNLRALSAWVSRGQKWQHHASVLHPAPFPPASWTLGQTGSPGSACPLEGPLKLEILTLGRTGSPWGLGAVGCTDSPGSFCSEVQVG